MVNDPKSFYGTDGTTAQGINQMAADGYRAVVNVEKQREYIMGKVKAAAGAGSDKVVDLGMKVDATTGAVSAGTSINVDISTGAGALVLDDMLQELSTAEQVAAQLVASVGKSQKQIHSQVGQG